MSLKNFTLLFVEDNIDAQEQIKMILEEDVKEFYQAFNGEEGLKVFKEKNPDIVLTDINMPYKNGLELALSIKKIDRTKPIIIMSAYDDRDNLLNSINLGSSGFITKPINVDQLYERLNCIAGELHKKETFQKKTEEKVENLYKLAHYDALTQIPNRLMFDEKFTNSIEDAKKQHIKLALFFIDIDNFKTINDTYGHDAGDFVLKSIVKHILNTVSSLHTLARISGDEFLLLVEDYTTEEFLHLVAKNIIVATSKDILWQGVNLQVSASVGISRFPKDADTKEELIRLADKAMYRAKTSGKSSYALTDEEHYYKVQPTFQTDKINIDKELYWEISTSRLIFQNREIMLTNSQRRFLKLLFTSVNQHFTYEQIYLHLWNDEYVEKKDSLKTLVKSLRKKLPFNFIKNVFGTGYKVELKGK